MPDFPDRITVGVAHLSPFLDVNDPEATVHAVGASHFKDYMTQMVGPEVPYDRHVRWLTDQVHDSLGDLSTDEALTVSRDDPLRYISHWLRLLEPLVETTKSLGRSVDAQLAEHERDADTLPMTRHQDLTYSLGLFDTSTIVIAKEFVLLHPRRHTAAQVKLNEMLPSNQRHNETFETEDAAAMEWLLSTNLLKTVHRRRITQLRNIGTKLITAAERDMNRMREVIPSFYFKDL